MCIWEHHQRELGFPLGITVFLLPAKLECVKLYLKTHLQPCVLYSRSSLVCNMVSGNSHMVRSRDIFLFLQLVRAQCTTAKFVKVLLGQQMGANFETSLFSKAKGTRQLLFPGPVITTLVAFAGVIWQNIHQISVKSAVGTKRGVPIAALRHILCCFHVISNHSGASWTCWEGKCHCARHIPSWKSRGEKVVVVGRQGKQTQISAWDFSASRKKYLEWRFLRGRDCLMEMLKGEC